MPEASRNLLFTIAAKLNLHVKSGVAWDSPPPGEATDRPGDDLNRRARWADILEPHQWVLEFERSGVCFWRRPGKAEHGHSATTGYCLVEGRDLMYVFSSNAVPFESESTYSKFAAYTLLNHNGDFKAAASALGAAGWGSPSKQVGKLLLANKGPRPNADTSDDPLDQDATAFDLVLANSYVRWAWEKWLPLGVLTILASEPGVGKTRFCADLARRVYLGLPWPDGSKPYFPQGSPSLWVPADNQHPELGTMPADFGFPPNALFLNATKRNPFGGTMLDDAEDLKDFEARIKRVRPALVFIDTSLNATDRSSHKPEDAKAFFVPLQQIAARQGIVLVCVTHLNAAGKPLGRRIEGQGRLVMMLEKPDPDGQPDRRKLWVKKSNSIIPPPLGVTMSAGGNEYDDKPPDKVEESDRPEGKPSGKTALAIVWLTDWLKFGPKRVSNTRTEAEIAGFSSTILYKAVRMLKVDTEEIEGKQWWRLREKPTEQF